MAYSPAKVGFFVSGQPEEGDLQDWVPDACAVDSDGVIAFVPPATPGARDKETFWWQESGDAQGGNEIYEGAVRTKGALRRTNLVYTAKLLSNASVIRFERTRAEVRARFEELVERWSAETKFSSSMSDLVFHEAYQSIIGLGEPVVPLLLERLEEAPEPWFWALRHITGEAPAPENSRPRDAAQAWVAWGRERGYLT